MTWKSVPSFKDVEASDTGNVRRSGIELKQSNRVRNYRCVNIDGKRILVHRLVLLAFIGMPKEGEECLHLNDDPTDNRLENLRWGSHKENMMMSRGRNHAHHGEDNGHSKLTASAVNEIRVAFLQKTNFHWGRGRLAKKFGVSPQQILRVAKHLPGGGWRDQKGENMFHQQGDILIEPAKIPTGTKDKPGNVLAEGEVTGHAHRVVCDEGAEAKLLELGGQLFLRILGGNAQVIHEEHKPQTLEPGDYQIRKVREFDHFAEEARDVAD